MILRTGLHTMKAYELLSAWHNNHNILCMTHNFKSECFNTLSLLNSYFYRSINGGEVSLYISNRSDSNSKMPEKKFISDKIKMFVDILMETNSTRSDEIELKFFKANPEIKRIVISDELLARDDMSIIENVKPTRLGTFGFIEVTKRFKISDFIRLAKVLNGECMDDDIIGKPFNPIVSAMLEAYFKRIDEQINEKRNKVMTLAKERDKKIDDMTKKAQKKIDKVKMTYEAAADKLREDVIKIFNDAKLT